MADTRLAANRPPVFLRASRRLPVATGTRPTPWPSAPGCRWPSAWPSRSPLPLGRVTQAVVRAAVHLLCIHLHSPSRHMRMQGSHAAGCGAGGGTAAGGGERSSGLGLLCHSQPGRVIVPPCSRPRPASAAPAAGRRAPCSRQSGSAGPGGSVERARGPPPAPQCSIDDKLTGLPSSDTVKMGMLAAGAT